VATITPIIFTGRHWPSAMGRYVSVAEPAADLTEDRNEKKKPNDIWSEWQDLNLRPLRPERSALPG
jgi:hypothetical protein